MPGRKCENPSMLDRREFLKLAALLPAACVTAPRPTGEWVNDIHPQLNRTWVSRVRRPSSLDELREVIRTSKTVCTAAGRHAMGGQQFASDATLLDMNGMQRVRSFDSEKGVIDVEA